VMSDEWQVGPRYARGLSWLITYHSSLITSLRLTTDRHR
jgi:hypothetical protein